MLEYVTIRYTGVYLVSASELVKGRTTGGLQGHKRCYNKMLQVLCGAVCNIGSVSSRYTNVAV